MFRRHLDPSWEGDKAVAEPTPYVMNRHFSQLVGRDVTFTQLTRANAPKGKQIYGAYKVLPGSGARVVQADLCLLGSLAGALAGLPSDSIKDRLAEKQLDELLRDAIHEVLNVASTVVTVEARAVFEGMYMDPVYLPEEANKTMHAPVFRSYFSVAVAGYEGGGYSLFAP